MADVLLAPIFGEVTIAPTMYAFGPDSNHLDLTGFREYRLVLNLHGGPNSKVRIEENFGLVGGAYLYAVVFDGTTDSSGNLIVRRKFDLYLPLLRVVVRNLGTAPLLVHGGTVYATK